VSQEERIVQTENVTDERSQQAEQQRALQLTDV
jgi:hypothetical protein